MAGPGFGWRVVNGIRRFFEERRAVREGGLGFDLNRRVIQRALDELAEDSVEEASHD